MDTTDSGPTQPANDSLESDPAYDYAEDAPVGDAAGSEEEDLFEEADRLVPLGDEDFLGEETPVTPPAGEVFPDEADEE